MGSEGKSSVVLAVQVEEEKESWRRVKECRVRRNVERRTC
jgi:hypothetical protein